MDAAILAVGSELLGTDRPETNSLRLAAALERHGFPLRSKVVVGDDQRSIAEALLLLLERAELVLVTGGLGPTADDLTRQATADALGRELELCQEILDEIAAKFSRFGMRMPEVNRRQAEIVEGAELIPNPQGTAPGMRLRHGDRTVFLFPGVPAELEGMIQSHLEPWLEARAPDVRAEGITLRVACLAESQLEERLGPVYEEFGRAGIGILAGAGEIRVRLEARGTEAERRARLGAMKARVSELVGKAVYGEGEETSLEAVLGELLRRAAATVATAESCTGGLIADRLTRIPGSSDYFVGGVVAYSNRLKEELLGVPEELIREWGAVSEEVAVAMAKGAREALGSHYAVAVTGIAGPGGGTEEKPVGTVHFALAGPVPDEMDHRCLRFPGDRERVRRLAGQWALDLLRRQLLGAGGPPGGR